MAVSIIMRAVRFFIISVISSVVVMILKSNKIAEAGFLSEGIFLLLIVIDSFRFYSYFYKKKDVKYGMMYPYLVFSALSIIALLFPENIYNWMFLPMRVFEGIGFPLLLSVIFSDVIVMMILRGMRHVRLELRKLGM